MIIASTMSSARTGWLNGWRIVSPWTPWRWTLSVGDQRLVYLLQVILSPCRAVEVAQGAAGDAGVASARPAGGPAPRAARGWPTSGPVRPLLVQVLSETSRSARSAGDGWLGGPCPKPHRTLPACPTRARSDRGRGGNDRERSQLSGCSTNKRADRESACNRLQGHLPRPTRRHCYARCFQWHRSDKSGTLAKWPSSTRLFGCSKLHHNRPARATTKEMGAPTAPCAPRTARGARGHQDFAWACKRCQAGGDGPAGAPASAGSNPVVASRAPLGSRTRPPLPPVKAPPSPRTPFT